MPVSIPQTEGLNTCQIEEAEQLLGCQLPESLKTCVRQHDGATPQDNVFDVPGNQSGVRRFVPLLEGAIRRNRIEGFPQHGVLFAEDDSGNYVWMDPTVGSVFFWDHEDDRPAEAIAATLQEFLDHLRPFDAQSVQLKPGQVISAWIDPDFKPEFD